MKTYKVEFIFDTGVSYEDRMCIIRAEGRAEAVNKFLEWIRPQLGGDEWVNPGSIKLKEIPEDVVVVYTNFHSNYRKYQ